MGHYAWRACSSKTKSCYVARAGPQLEVFMPQHPGAVIPGMRHHTIFATLWESFNNCATAMCLKSSSPGGQ